MKNVFLGCVAVFLLTTSTLAQKKTKTTATKQLVVPENVSTSFKSQFTIATDNQWNKNYSGNYVATFVNAEKAKQVVEFSQSGAVIKSKTTVLPSALSEAINSSINTQYPGAKVVEASRMQMPGVAPYFKIQILGSDNIAKELLISDEGTITE